MNPIRLGILGSTRGTDMLAIIAAIKQKKLHASIEIVISNKKNALILERAKSVGIPAEFADPNNLTMIEYDHILSNKMQTHQVDLIVLIGYMRILSADFVIGWQNKIINIHPSLLPAFAGGMNNDVHKAVLAAGVKETGCTVHYVTEVVDAGPIILQKRCKVLPLDTVESLKTRVQELEGDALIEAIENIRSTLSRESI
jgi:phosphoribosylglycinamide formyltransferase-1